MRASILIPVLFTVPSLCDAAISLAGPSVGAGWVSLGANFDFLDDQQTGDPSSDIVGSGNDPGFFTSFDNAGTASTTDGFVGFRVRLDAVGGTKNSPKFDRNLWVGIDADLNGSIDVFLGVATPGSNTTLGIYDAGNGLNTSPNTTTIAGATYTYAASASNYNYRPVNNLTDGGTTNDLTTSSIDDPDYYVTFLVPLAELAAAITTRLPSTFGPGSPFTENTVVRYGIATSTQSNSLNQDLGGINNKTANLAQTWTQLGGFTSPTSPNLLVPEPSATMIAALGIGLGSAIRRRRSVS